MHRRNEGHTIGTEVHRVESGVRLESGQQGGGSLVLEAVHTQVEVLQGLHAATVS